MGKTLSYFDRLCQREIGPVLRYESDPAELYGRTYTTLDQARELIAAGIPGYMCDMYFPILMSSSAAGYEILENEEPQYRGYGDENFTALASSLTFSMDKMKSFLPEEIFYSTVTEDGSVDYDMATFEEGFAFDEHKYIGLYKTDNKDKIYELYSECRMDLLYEIVKEFLRDKVLKFDIIKNKVFQDSPIRK